MAYTAFNATEILPTKPVKTELWNKVKDNFDNHESRLVTVEASALTSFPIEFIVEGPHSQFGAQVGIAYLRVPYNLTLTSAKLFVVNDGTSGTLQVDVQKKTGAGAFATIFSTKPSVVFGGGDYQTSTNGILSATTILAGDILRLDISTVMVGNKAFQVYLQYTVS